MLKEGRDNHGGMIVDLSICRTAGAAFVESGAPVDYQPQDRTSTHT